MTLQAFKDGTLAAAKCRLSSPPLSPSRSHGTTAIQHTKSNTKPPFKSKLLAAFDSDIAFQGSGNFFGAGASSSEFEAQVKANVSSSYAVTRPTRQALTPNSSSLTAPGRVQASLANKSVVAAKPTDLTSSVVSKAGASANANDGAAQPEAEVAAPLYSYKDYTPTPTIVYTRHEEEANDIVETLQGPVGFDMEWRVFYRKGIPPTERRVATIQISDRKIILIVQVSAMKKFPKKVKELIENPAIPKIGANIRNDGQKLLRDYDVTAANLVELGALARHADPSFVSKRNIVSLARMIEEYCDGRVLDKGPVRMSNWECVPLSREQLDYAANDAHSALMAYRRLLEIAASNERTLDPATFSSSISKDDPPPLPKVTTAKALTGPSPAPPAPDSVSSSALAYTDLTGPGGGLPPNVWGAYRLWHEDDLPLHEICKALRSAENPLARSTVISYVVRALRTQTALPYSLERLKALVQLDGGSWVRYREWIRRQEVRSLE